MKHRYDPAAGRWAFESKHTGDAWFPALAAFLVACVVLSIGGLLIALIRML